MRHVTNEERLEDFEDLLGGRLLAWVGGAAVVLGLCFLLAIAVSRGWLGEVERTLLAGSASLALLRPRESGCTATGAAPTPHGPRWSAGIAGLFATAVVASSVYGLVLWRIVALVGSLAVGTTATALALRCGGEGDRGARHPRRAALSGGRRCSRLMARRWRS